ncbi:MULTISPECIES: SphA family protein [Bradyrhizobium]|uniref:SphA family protein n=1 Tax=Bradyrhizobium TaxID=374 RepID=UPI002714C74B|nr:transporter [Bradyrhizobium elkanii]WLA50654.1 transporter [Bradyrhizobium elkanii]WLB79108.1 transporter [Bradyrhizobium elkanii]
MKTVKNHKRAVLGIVGAIALSTMPRTALADAGGLSFWLPGAFASLTAAPAVPGWAYETIYIHLDTSANAGKNFVIGNRVPGSVVAGLNAHADVLIEGFTYTWAQSVLGGQAAVTFLTAPGNIGVGVDATLTGPRGNTVSGVATDNRNTVSDVFYQGTLKWNQGVNNEMFYIFGNIPSGTYDSSRLANLSFGFTAIDVGGAYTYLNPESGQEFSVLAGVTYNGMNKDLQYQNGIDFHVDWGLSKFVAKNVHVGVAGYYFQQLTGDSGAGAKLGDFKGRVAGIGPQVGFIFPVADGYQGYLNVRGYKDFAAENRPEGWTAWVTFQLSPAAPAATPTKPIVRKY